MQLIASPKVGRAPKTKRAGVELPGLRVLLSLDLKGKEVGRQEMPGISKGAELLRDEHWAESQGLSPGLALPLTYCLTLGSSHPFPEA